MSALAPWEPLGRCGVVRAVASDADLITADDAQVRDLFRQHGLLLWRGASASAAAFDALARRFTATHFIGYGRQPFPGLPTITAANETGLPLEPHCDNGIRPEAQQPDITWFLCDTPAEDEGETTVFDGTAVWRSLPAPTRELFSAQRIRFTTRYAAQAWRQMGYADPDSFGRFIETLGGTVLRVHPDQSVDTAVLSPAVRRTRFSGELAFVSSLCLAGSRGFDALSVSLEDGSEIPASVHRDVRDALEANCELIRWRSGDVAMLDNTRFLHGRRAYRDPRRRLYLIQTLRASF